MTTAAPPTSSQDASDTKAPLAGLVVVDMSQFLSGPSAALRLADLGARVIKVERPDGGDICRALYLSDTKIDGDSTIFHAINRNKESLALDFKQPRDIARLHRLASRADVVIQNFRPGVAERLGVGPYDLRDRNPRLVYASISGYGETGNWAALPGQDLLAQALTGIGWLSGNAADGPVPIGLPVADIIAGHILSEGILAALIRRSVSGRGGHVETSLMEALVDLQFEVLSTYINDGRRAPQRGAVLNAHAYLAAPYGFYPTRDGHLALAMTPLGKLGRLLDLPALGDVDAANAFSRRDEIKAKIATRVAQETTAHWLDLLRPHDVWCAPVLDWQGLFASDAFHRLDMQQRVVRGNHRQLNAMRTPLRIDGRRDSSTRGAPRIGEHSAALIAEFRLDG